MKTLFVKAPLKDCQHVAPDVQSLHPSHLSYYFRHNCYLMCFKKILELILSKIVLQIRTNQLPSCSNVLNVFAFQFCTTARMPSHFKMLCLFLWIQTTLPFVVFYKMILNCVQKSDSSCPRWLPNTTLSYRSSASSATQ